MPPLSPRGARFAAPLVGIAAVAVLAGCGGSQPRTAPTTSPATTTSAATTDSAAAAASSSGFGARLLAAAGRVLAHQKSYRFNAVELVQAHQTITTRVSGTVVRTQGLTYMLTAGGHRTQVVRLRHATYVRKLPGRWLRLKHPAPATDPTRTLAAVLRGVTATTERQSVAGAVVTGILPAAAAKAAGIPATGRGAQVSVTLNGARQVVLLQVRTAALADGTPVPVVLTTRYSAFGNVPPLRPPR